MKKSILTAAFVAACPIVGIFISQPANAQNAILAEMYGRGVHAYYGGRYEDANQFLSMSINNGSKDPRAYYFRGLVANAQGRSYEAEADWRQGAELEARVGGTAAIGRSLSRFQGPDRLKLEELRQKARLEVVAKATARSEQRYGEINGGAVEPLSASPRKPIAPPPIPPANDNPFADEIDNASGTAKVESDDAFAGAMDAGGAAPAAGAAADAAPAADAGGLFDAGPAAADDPFAPGAGGAADDPFK